MQTDLPHCILGKIHYNLDVVQQLALSTADPGRCHKENSPLLNCGPLKMHARSRLCIFNEVCLKYLIASRSFGKQIHLLPLIFDAEMNKCKTHTLISPFLSIVSVCCRRDVSARLAPHRQHWHAAFCGLLSLREGFSIYEDTNDKVSLRDEPHWRRLWKPANIWDPPPIREAEPNKHQGSITSTRGKQTSGRHQARTLNMSEKQEDNQEEETPLRCGVDLRVMGSEVTEAGRRSGTAERRSNLCNIQNTLAFILATILDAILFLSVAPCNNVDFACIHALLWSFTSIHICRHCLRILMFLLLLKLWLF